jgi:hypothetical protein
VPSTLLPQLWLDQCLLRGQWQQQPTLWRPLRQQLWQQRLVWVRILHHLYLLQLRQACCPSLPALVECLLALLLRSTQQQLVDPAASWRQLLQHWQQQQQAVHVLAWAAPITRMLHNSQPQRVSLAVLQLVWLLDLLPSKVLCPQLLVLQHQLLA